MDVGALQLLFHIPMAVEAHRFVGLGVRRLAFKESHRAAMKIGDVSFQDLS